MTNNRFPASYGFMRWYLAPLVDADSRAARAGGTLVAMLRDPRAATANIRARDWNRRITVLTVMQHDDNEIALELRRGPLGWGLRSRLAPGAAPIPTYLPQANAVGSGGGRGERRNGVRHASRPGARDRRDGAHPRRGGDRHLSVEGVVDAHHRVFATADGDVHDDLRVLDGSAVPANIGVNPSLTITALAERAMSLR